MSDSLQPHDCSTSGLPVHQYLPEFAQTHVHWVSDAIQPSHPLPSPSLPDLIFPSKQGLSQWVGSSHQWPKYWSFSFSISPSNKYLGLISLRIDCLDRLAVQGILKSPASQFKGISSLVLGLFYCQALTSIHDYWKNHSFDYADFVGKVMSLLFNTLSRFVIVFLPKSKRLLISWLLSPSAVILEPKK